MIMHEYTKYEIATYLRDYNKLMMYARENKTTPLYSAFLTNMKNDGRKQYSLKDYYYEMISIYEMLLSSKFLTMSYDNYFKYLLDAKIDEASIPDTIFVNPKDKLRFSKKNIITYIRNAFNHNDNSNHDLLRFIRVREGEKEDIKVEILLKGTNPIPFHVILDKVELIKICFEIKKADTLHIGSLRSLEQINLNHNNVSETLNSVYYRKFYSEKKLTDDQITTIMNEIEKNNGSKGIDGIMIANGLKYKDITFNLAQKMKVEEDLKYWEKMGILGNNIVEHLLYKVLPLSYQKDRVFIVNLILADFYARNGNKALINLMSDARNVYDTRICEASSPLNIYANTYGINEDIIYDTFDIDNIVSLTNAIYYGFLFDTLITDEEIKINDTKTEKRETLRNSFVHMRWYKGVNECFKLFDWENGINNEYNSKAEGFKQINIKYDDIENCAEKYFQSYIEPKTITDDYMSLPIHFKKYHGSVIIDDEVSISYIKKGKYYYLNIDKENPDYVLKVMDKEQILRSANEEEINNFIKELDNLTEEEKKEYSEIIENVKNQLSQSDEKGSIKL